MKEDRLIEDRQPYDLETAKKRFEEEDARRTAARATCDRNERENERRQQLIQKKLDAMQIATQPIDTTLTERGSRYGIFAEHARITQALKAAMVDSPNWAKLPADMREALEMVQHKIGRILNGDPNYHDSWHDIEGYTKLVADRLATGVEK